MLRKNSSTTNILLLGLGDTLEQALEKALSRQNQAVHSRPLLNASECSTLIDRLAPKLVFCGAEPEHYKALIAALKHKRPDLPVVVVSRRGEVSEWLDALGAGASDYCAPPFESTQIQWILHSALKRQAVDV